MTAKITINGKTFTGNSITMIGNEVFIDGKAAEQNFKQSVEIIVNGDLASLKSDSSVTVNGNVIGDIDAGGSVSCNDVKGNIDAGGSVKCGNVGGDIDARGSVRFQK